jgi:cytochrome P450
VSRLPGPRGPRELLAVARGLTHDPHAALRGMRATHGPVVEAGRGPFRYTYLLSPEANEHVLATDPGNFRWRDAFQPLVVVNGETALVVSDGDDHRRRRRLVQPAFHRRRVAGYLTTMATEADRVLDGWVPGTTVDAYAQFRLAIRRITLRCLFGGALLAREAALAEHLEVALAYVNRPPTRRVDHDLPGLPYRAAVRARRAVDALVFAEIQRRRDAGDPGDDVLGWLLETQDGDADLTDQEVRDQVVSLVAAGYDTTASAMGWAVAELAADPTHAQVIRDELANVGALPLDVTHLGRLTYTNAFVTEVLRAHPPAMWSGRRAVDDFTLHGHTIRGGSMVLFSPEVTHHLPDQFPEPDAFRPGRWIPGHPHHDDPHPYAYIPFGGGPRRCLGFAFATQELVTLVALLAARADIAPAHDGPLRPTGTMSSAPAGGVPIRVGAVRAERP